MHSCLRAQIHGTQIEMSLSVVLAFISLSEGFQAAPHAVTHQTALPIMSCHWTKSGYIYSRACSSWSKRKDLVVYPTLYFCYYRYLFKNRKTNDKYRFYLVVSKDISYSSLSQSFSVFQILLKTNQWATLLQWVTCSFITKSLLPVVFLRSNNPKYIHCPAKAPCLQRPPNKCPANWLNDNV